ncbi:MarR family winged helix-turn-helix transcriptional regulator [Pseudonocardia lacus]|jgi:DNA-binding MarR family transcriptional regulator|uniref:MarR family winged helix-turn-helix transcriptional regulator n=1 Tax=Pseudonocardia lacus TaxID=2835865 RepID=UPI001BDD8D5F|nr:MarR family winged helix-turn-helix transcriptional regulator [Pseudonocardia lacus]
MVQDGTDRSVAAVAAAMVAVRRQQSRRALGRAAGASDVDIAVQEVLDAVDVADAAGAPVGVTGVAGALAVDQPRASKLVAAAVAAGLVRREADQADGRRSRLVLTADGRERLAHVHAHREARFAAAMADWSEAERAAFAALLTRFVAGLGR